jgi:hypothetical protein
MTVLEDGAGTSPPGVVSDFVGVPWVRYSGAVVHPDGGSRSSVPQHSCRGESTAA